MTDETEAVRTAREWFEELLPAIRENVRTNEMLAPAMFIRNENKQMIVGLGEWFASPESKDGIVPMVRGLFAINSDIDEVAVMSECWRAKLDPSIEDPSDEGPVSEMPNAVEGVSFMVYRRDWREDVAVFALINSDRSDVTYEGATMAADMQGRLVAGAGYDPESYREQQRRNDDDDA